MLLDILDQFPLKKADFQLEEIDGELLLYSPKSTRSVYLNASASLIWRFCDGTQTVREIIQMLLQAFPEAAESIEKDVLDTVQNFFNNNAIQLSMIRT